LGREFAAPRVDSRGLARTVSEPAWAERAGAVNR